MHLRTPVAYRDGHTGWQCVAESGLLGGSATVAFPANLTLRTEAQSTSGAAYELVTTLEVSIANHVRGVDPWTGRGVAEFYLSGEHTVGTVSNYDAETGLLSTVDPAGCYLFQYADMADQTVAPEAVSFALDPADREGACSVEAFTAAFTAAPNASSTMGACGAAGAGSLTLVASNLAEGSPGWSAGAYAACALNRTDNTCSAERTDGVHCAADGGAGAPVDEVFCTADPVVNASRPAPAPLSRTCDGSLCVAYGTEPGSCDAPCGGGQQTATVTCVSAADGGVLVDLTVCDALLPPATKPAPAPAPAPCNTQPCGAVRVGNWSGCESASAVAKPGCAGVQRRTVECRATDGGGAGGAGTLLAASQCPDLEDYNTTRPCELCPCSPPFRPGVDRVVAHVPSLNATTAGTGGPGAGAPAVVLADTGADATGSVVGTDGNATSTVDGVNRVDFCGAGYELMRFSEFACVQEADITALCSAFKDAVGDRMIGVAFREEEAPFAHPLYPAETRFRAPEWVSANQTVVMDVFKYNATNANCYFAPYRLNGAVGMAGAESVAMGFVDPERQAAAGICRKLP